MSGSMIPDLLYALAVLVLASAFFVMSVRGNRRLSAQIGRVHVVADAVNAAVNNVQPGEPPLRQVVVEISDKLDRHMAESNARLDQIEESITNPRRGAA